MKQPTRPAAPIIATIVLLTISLLVFAGWQGWIWPLAGAQNTTDQASTSRVRSADLVITANGAGTLEKVEIPLGFAIPGTLLQIAQPGQVVTAGEPLAMFDSQKAALDLQKAELAWEKLTSASTLATVKLAELQAQMAVIDVQQKYDQVVLGPNVDYYKSLLAFAERDYWSALAALESTRALAATDPRAGASLRRLKAQLSTAELALEEAKANLAWALAYQPAPADALLADGKLQSAQSQLAAQTSTLKALQAGETQLLSFENSSSAEILALQNAWADLEQARRVLAANTLTVPFSGTIIQVTAQPGGQVSAFKPVLTLVTDAPFTVQFSIDESEISLLSAGDPFSAVPAAYPNLELHGKVTVIAPVVGQDAQITVWGEVQPDELVIELMPGMSVDVTVTLAESKNTLILTNQAIQRDENGQAFVNLLQSDGSLRPAAVTLGLSDFANVEILSGLKAGDEVSTLNVNK